MIDTFISPNFYTNGSDKTYFQGIIKPKTTKKYMSERKIARSERVNLTMLFGLRSQNDPS